MKLHSDHGHSHSSDASLWEGYLELMTDVPHVLVEVTFTLIPIVVFELGRRVWGKAMERKIDRRVAEEHLLIDAEHGVEHHGEETPML